MEKVGKPAGDQKWIYRIMRHNGLLLTGHTGKQAQPSHQGTVIILRSDLSWCSGRFEIACWNGQMGAGCRCTGLSRPVNRGGSTRLNNDPRFLSGISADSHAASLTVGSITA
jgi:hypothetical protein